MAVDVLYLTNPLRRTIEQPSIPQKPHTNPRSYSIICRPTCLLIALIGNPSPHTRHGIFSQRSPDQKQSGPSVIGRGQVRPWTEWQDPVNYFGPEEFSPLLCLWVRRPRNLENFNKLRILAGLDTFVPVRFSPPFFPISG